LLSLVKAARSGGRTPPTPLRQDGRAAMAMRIGGGATQTLTLAGDEGFGKQLWSSPAHVAIETRNGRIVRTAGLDYDLTGFVSYENSATDEPAWGRRHAFQWTADLADLGIYAAPVSCEDIPGPQQTVSIHGVVARVFRVDETCRCAQLDWSFNNVFWVSLSGDVVWRSVQHVHPRLAAVDLMLAAAPGRNDAGR
jgi:hypothetical protein